MPQGRSARMRAESCFWRAQPASSTGGWTFSACPDLQADACYRANRYSPIRHENRDGSANRRPALSLPDVAVGKTRTGSPWRWGSQITVASRAPDDDGLRGQRQGSRSRVVGFNAAEPFGQPQARAAACERLAVRSHGCRVARTASDTPLRVPPRRRLEPWCGAQPAVGCAWTTV